MDNLTVGENSPIKLKVSVQTEALPMSYGFLYQTINDELPYSRIPAFDPTMKTGWKTLDKGNVVSNKIFRVLTFFRFFNSFPNEETFDLAIEQIKNSYLAEISGGSPTPYKMSFTTESFYSSKTCILESELKLI